MLQDTGQFTALGGITSPVRCAAQPKSEASLTYDHLFVPFLVKGLDHSTGLSDEFPKWDRPDHLSRNDLHDQMLIREYVDLTAIGEQGEPGNRFALSRFRVMAPEVTHSGSDLLERAVSFT